MNRGFQLKMKKYPKNRLKLWLNRQLILIGIIYHQSTLILCNTKQLSTLVCFYVFMCLFIGTIGHVAHGKSTVVKAISGVQVRTRGSIHHL